MNLLGIFTFISQWVPVVISAAAAAAAVFPQGRPGTLWGTVRSVIDKLAMNFGNASNAPKH